MTLGRAWRARAGGRARRQLEILAILGAMGAKGMLATMTVEATADGGVFLACLDPVLFPKLRPGQVAALDNLSSHKVLGVRERIEAAGTRVLFLPPYSPGFNLVEKPWARFNSNSALKRHRRLKLSIRSSPPCCQRSAREMPQPGPGCRLKLYKNR